MTFSSYTYQIDGGLTTSQLWRQALEAATSGSLGGIIDPLDLLVTATSTPSSGIQIADGRFLVNGQEAADQGTYFGYNAGTDTSLTIAPTTGTARSDLIVVRVEDPAFSGSPWSGPVSSQTIFPRVISNVSSTATVPPAGISAIPLARIDMPSSASTVLQGYITDLRQVANPKRDRQVLNSAGPGSATAWTVGTTATAWPPSSWSVAVPSWATWVKMRWSISSAVFAGGGNGWARGSVYPVFGTSVTSPNVTFPSRLVSVNYGSGGAEYEVFSIDGTADTSIPASVRGTTQTLKFAQTTDGTNTGVVQVTEGALMIADIEFHQRAVTA